MRFGDKDRTDEWSLFDRLIVFRLVCDTEVDLTTPFWVIVAGLVAWGIFG